MDDLLKLYSEQRTPASSDNVVTQMPTLREMARRVCIKNLQSIPDIGETPYDVAKPLLLHTDPKQLYDFECKSPQIIGADAEIWRAFIQRDFEASKGELKEPANPKDWYLTYRRLARKQREKNKADEMELKEKMDTWRAEKAKNTSRKAELDFVKPPPGIKSSNEIIRTKANARRFLSDAQGSKTFDRDLVRKQREEARMTGQPLRHKKPGEIPSNSLKGRSQLDRLRKEVLDARRARPSVRNQISQRSQHANPSPIQRNDEGQSPTMERIKKRRREPADESSDTDSSHHAEKRIKVGIDGNLARETSHHRAATESPPSKASLPAVASLPMASGRNYLHPSPDQDGRARTASPSTEITRPIKRAKKAPVNIFMPVKKARPA